ncbi:DsrE family protein [Hydrogenothermus marinus]|uniref:Uncharacterized protein n=1 Tax=Hydrogenothermus marinus TaxID=133270 RepID=A0A3M0BZN6_9AQUI|nr:DsrE family protein [Hydrogenothermus marinus]RMA96142.1 hypothetical protein CLV39_1156 [Hydrogenothermus marinus]
MKTLKILIIFPLIFLFSISYAKEKKLATFEVSEETYPTIKVVYDWNLSSPEDVNQALNYISNHIKAYTQYAPFSELKIVVVSHGPEAVIFAKQNKDKFKQILERIKSFHDAYGVKFYVCNNILKFMGFKREDIQPFAIITPAGVAKLAALQEEGYRLVPAVVHNLKAIKEKYGKK